MKRLNANAEQPAATTYEEIVNAIYADSKRNREAIFGIARDYGMLRQAVEAGRDRPKALADARATFANERRSSAPDDPGVLNKAAWLVGCLEDIQGTDWTLERWEQVIEALQARPKEFYRNPTHGHEVHEEEKHGSSVPQQPRRPKRGYRSQVGYTPPKRAKTVILKTSVRPPLREDFHGVAKTIGVTSEVLLEYLAQSAVTKASADPAFMTALKNAVAEHAKRSEDARDGVLTAVSDAILKRTLG